MNIPFVPVKASLRSEVPLAPARFLVLLLLPVLLPHARPVGATDLITYQFSKCLGSGTIFGNIPYGRCTVLPSFPLSLLYNEGTSCGGSSFSDGACVKGFVQAVGGTCLTPGYVICSSQYVACTIFDRRRRLLLAPPPGDARAADRQGGCVRPQMTGVAYTQDPTKGSWILHSANASELAVQLAAVDTADIAEWFLARGGSFSSTHGGTTR